MATFTVTTTAAEDARLVVAYGKELGLGRNATGAEIKAKILQDGPIAVCQRWESMAAIASATASVSQISPT